MKGKQAEPEPPIVFAVPQTPPSSDPERTAIRVAGITFLVPTRSRPCPTSPRRTDRARRLMSHRRTALFARTAGPIRCDTCGQLEQLEPEFDRPTAVTSLTIASAAHIPEA